MQNIFESSMCTLITWYNLLAFETLKNMIKLRNYNKMAGQFRQNDKSSEFNGSAPRRNPLLVNEGFCHNLIHMKPPPNFNFCHNLIHMKASPNSSQSKLLKIISSAILI